MGLGVRTRSQRVGDTQHYPQDNVCSICRDAKFCVSTTPQVLTFPHHAAKSPEEPTIPFTASTTASLFIKEKQNNFLPKSLNEAPNV